MLKRLLMPLFLLAVLASASVASAARAKDATGLWVTSMYGNTVECHLEQRGNYLFGVAYVTTRTGDHNTYHLAGVVQDGQVRAMHGAGHIFVGAFDGENHVSGQFTFKDGPTIALQAERVKRGITTPGGLQWPAGLGPAQ